MIHNALLDPHYKAIQLAEAMLRDATKVWKARRASARVADLIRLRLLYRFIRARVRGDSEKYRKPDGFWVVLP